MTESNFPVSEMIRIESDPQVPWTFKDTWIGFGLFFTLLVGFGFSKGLAGTSLTLTVLFLIYQPLQFIPVGIILLLRKATWKDLGFVKASPNVLGLGCGFVILSYIITFINNTIMILLKIPIQAERFSDLASALKSPFVFLLVGTLFAPILEETIFRGFIFPGLRQKLGWQKAAVINSAIFAFCHFQLAAFIPTFILGLAFSYLYQRSSSIWPGIIMHTLVNSFGLCVLVTFMQNGIPTTL